MWVIRTPPQFLTLIVFLRADDCGWNLARWNGGDDRNICDEYLPQICLDGRKSFPFIIYLLVRQALRQFSER